MTLAIIILSVLCLLLFICCWALVLQAKENAVIAEYYKQDYHNIQDRYDHILTQIGQEGFRITEKSRSFCNIELVKEENS